MHDLSQHVFSSAGNIHTATVKSNEHFMADKCLLPKQSLLQACAA